MYQNLHPYHPDSQLQGHLSPAGLALIEREHSQLQDRLKNWAGGTKYEYLRGYTTLQELQVVRCEIHCDDPAEVEYYLKWHAAQVGGNGYVKFFWDKQVDHHEHKYIAGYGSSGNPYYKTKRSTTTYYTGNAIAVRVIPRQLHKQKADKDSDYDSRSNSQDSENDLEMCYRLFKLSSSASWEEIEKAYKSKAKIHHPDHGGDEDIMKALNEAYFRLKMRHGKTP